MDNRTSSPESLASALRMFPKRIWKARWRAKHPAPHHWLLPAHVERRRMRASEASCLDSEGE